MHTHEMLLTKNGQYFFFPKILNISFCQVPGGAVTLDWILLKADLTEHATTNAFYLLRPFGPWLAYSVCIWTLRMPFLQSVRLYKRLLITLQTVFITLQSFSSFLTSTWLDQSTVNSAWLSLQPFHNHMLLVYRCCLMSNFRSVKLNYGSPPTGKAFFFMSVSGQCLLPTGIFMKAKVSQKYIILHV